MLIIRPYFKFSSFFNISIILVFLFLFQYSYSHSSILFRIQYYFLSYVNQIPRFLFSFYLIRINVIIHILSYSDFSILILINIQIPKFLFSSHQILQIPVFLFSFVYSNFNILFLILYYALLFQNHGLSHSSILHFSIHVIILTIPILFLVFYLFLPLVQSTDLVVEALLARPIPLYVSN